jgi:Ca2+-binding RTX toxin-like protein
MSLPTDDRFADQWHLLNLAPGEYDLRLFDGATSVWDEYTGAGVRVAIIDDGVQSTHPDLDGNHDASFEILGESGEPLTATDSHGTAVAGLIAAERDGSGTVGIAYDAHWTAMNAIGENPTSALVDAIVNAQNFDVVNNSWGAGLPTWSSQFGDDAEDNYFDALEALATAGRGGLGTIFVKSAGNGRADGENTNFDATHALPSAVVVAAVDRDGFVSEYSTEGASILVSAFGTPGEVVTTDLTGAGGTAPGDTTDAFNGTSAAAPMVTGIVALMLQANPDLGWRDVNAILALSARHTGSAVGAAPQGSEYYGWTFNGARTWNGQGLHFSEDYGFGLVDALAAVRLAESWDRQQTSANQATLTVGPALAFPPQAVDGSGTVSVDFVVAGTLDVEQVRLDLDLAHSDTGDLFITLTSPAGTTSVLLWQNGAGTPVPEGAGLDISLASNAFRDEAAAGVWTLTIDDQFTDAFTGTLSAAQMVLNGRSGADDVIVMTNEASDFLAGGAVLSDTDGGIDTLNAAAVSSASRIDLSGATATVIDGVGFAVIDSIEDAAGGDGADTLIGSFAANLLRGFRGGDTLDGAAGEDTLDGGRGADRMVGGLDDDFYLVDNADDVAADLDADHLGSGIDTVQAWVSYALDGGFGQRGWGIENLVLGGSAAIDATGNDLDNTLVGNAGANRLDGGAGWDTVAGGLGGDVLVGGDGLDVLILDEGTLTPGGTYDLGAPSFAVGGGSAEGFEWMVGTSADERILATRIDTLLQGEGGNDLLRGHEFDDTLLGGAGADVLQGSAGDDSLDGGSGADAMAGGTGADRYVVDDAGDRIVEVNDAFAGGHDGVNASVSFRLPTAVEDLRLVGTAALTATGNGLDNLIHGNDGANVLDGGAGIDTLAGGGAADLYRVDHPDDEVVEFTGAPGEDTVEASVSYSLGNSNAEVLVLVGTAVTGEGGDLRNDRLLGNTLANQLAGLGGNDTLDGGAGADTLVGGAGNDVYRVDASGDVTGESTGGGTDTVLALVSHTLASELEHLVLEGSAASGKGNALANRLTGNAASNTLDGAAGNDTLTGNAGNDQLVGGTGNDSMAGGTGNDTYTVDAAGDVVSELGSTSASEVDTVKSFVTHTLASRVEVLLLQGTTAIQGTGNTLANTLTGNAGANVLDGAAGIDKVSGGAGHDTVDGGSGNDSLTGGSGADAFRFRTTLDRTLNVDRISDFVSVDDRFLLDDAVFTGIGAVGALSSAAFRLGTSAGDTSDRIVYDRTTGQLFFDADGTGAKAAVLFATVVAGTSIGVGDFFVT